MHEEQRPVSGPIKSPQGFAAGLFLVALATLALWLGRDLNLGTLRAMGPGMVPHWVALMVGAAGFVLMLIAVFKPGQRLEAWGVRGIFFVLGAVVLFGLSVRTYGLIVAAPLALMACAFATPEVRWKEAAIFALVMSYLCILLFFVLLNLPITLCKDLPICDLANSHFDFIRSVIKAVMGLFGRAG